VFPDWPETCIGVCMKLSPQYDTLAFHEQSLLTRAYRQEVLGSNLANADTPNYKARDVQFADVLQQRLQGLEINSRLTVSRTSSSHFETQRGAEFENPNLLYRRPIQPALDGNTVDADVERTHFAQNAMMMQAAIEFFSGSIKSRLQAISGQPG